MDSKVVAREIKREIWPSLRQEGFTKFNPRTAWRHTPEQVHVINYQSFNSYLADGIGCTTFSFSVNLGIYIRAIPFEYPVGKGADPSVKPQEYHCHFRRRLLKGIDQPVLSRRDTWYVEMDGSNLAECLDDSRSAILREGFLWFKRFESLEAVLSMLVEEESLPEVLAARNSAERKRMIGYLAERLGLIDLSETMLAAAAFEKKQIEEKLNSIRRDRTLRIRGKEVGCGGKI